MTISYKKIKEELEKENEILTQENEKSKNEKKESEAEIEVLRVNLKNQKEENVISQSKIISEHFSKAKDDYGETRKVWSIILIISIFIFIIFLFFNPVIGKSIADTEVISLISRWIFNFVILSWIVFASAQYSKADNNFDDFRNRQAIAESTKTFLENFDSENFPGLRENLLKNIPNVLFKNIESPNKNSKNIPVNIFEKLIEKIPNG